VNLIARSHKDIRHVSRHATGGRLLAPVEAIDQQNLSDCCQRFNRWYQLATICSNISSRLMEMSQEG
jgi:hypothetical protein